MTYLAAFLGRLPDDWKALTALGGAIAFGATVGMVMSGFFSVPNEVQEVRQLAEENAEWRASHTREFQALVCLLTLPDSVDRQGQLRECGL